MGYNPTDKKWDEVPAWKVSIVTGAEYNEVGWYPGATKAEALDNAFFELGPHTYVCSVEVTATRLLWAQQWKQLTEG